MIHNQNCPSLIQSQTQSCLISCTLLNWTLTMTESGNEADCLRMHSNIIDYLFQFQFGYFTILRFHFKVFWGFFWSLWNFHKSPEGVWKWTGVHCYVLTELFVMCRRSMRVWKPLQYRVWCRFNSTKYCTVQQRWKMWSMLCSPMPQDWALPPRFSYCHCHCNQLLPPKL